MNEDQNTSLEVRKHKVLVGLSILLMVLSAFFFVKIFVALKTYSTIGADIPPQATISVTGKGEVTAKPGDVIAELSFGVESEQATVAEAQRNVTEKMSKVVEFLKNAGVEDKDIKTTGYNAYPRYEYKRTQVVPCNEFGCPPTDNKRVLSGYAVSQRVTVKVRDIDDSGKVIGGLGELNVTNLSGLNFKVDNDEALKEEARKIAIEKAKAKADKLAKDLGVRLVRVVGFNEGGAPVYRTFTAEAQSFDAKRSTPEIPTGENTVTSSVTIVYEIR